jgi:hypothetical protein
MTSFGRDKRMIIERKRKECALFHVVEIANDFKIKLEFFFTSHVKDITGVCVGGGLAE